MNAFEQWLTANGYDAEAMKKPENATQRKHLEAAWKAETSPPAPVPEPLPVSVDDKLAIHEAEAERISAITAMADKWAGENTRNPDKIRQLREIRDGAIADKKMDVIKFALAMTRFDRASGLMILTPKRQEATAEVLEAAVCMAGGLETVEKQYTDQTLQTARDQFKNGISLHGVIGHCARQNGWNGHDIKSNWYQAVKYAFRNHGGDEMYAAVTGPSTYSLPNILANIANKFLRIGFENVDQAWSKIAARRNFNDFKTATTAALTGSLLYKKLPPSGEIKHGTIGEVAYTNKADTYAVLLGIDRQSLVNDDLGALTSAGRRLGRGAALALNNQFWTIFLNNSSFFTAGNNNVATGAGTVLSLTSLAQADSLFRMQTDPDGLPLGTMATILLTPPAIRITGLNLMNSTTVVSTTTANQPVPDQNAFVGAYEVVSSPYMQNSTYTGNSSTAWYLLASPNDLPVIEVGFLNGQESPTVETDAAEFNMLGIAMRGYYDFGVALQEFRGGVRMAGA